MKILYFAPVYYDDMKQRPQQLAECLSKHHDVYYVEPTVSWIRWILKRGPSYRGFRRKISRTFTVIRLDGSRTFHKSAEILDPFGWNNRSEYRQIKTLAKRCDLVWVGYPGWYTLIRHIRQKPVVYDKMDEDDLLAKNWLLKLTLWRNKRKLAKRSELIFVTGRKFYQEFQGKKPVYLVPNALSREFFMQCRQTADHADDTDDADRVDDADCADHADHTDRAYPSGRLSGQQQKGLVFGYIGTIGDWFDFSVIRYLLSLPGQHSIVLAGKNLMPVFSHERVTYLGIRPHEELPKLIGSFDVCLYNFKKSRLLDTINPVKIYEYLAMKKPVLAVDSRETRALKKYLMIYRNTRQIAALLAHGPRQPFSGQAEYEVFVRKNTWENRAAIIENALHLLEERKHNQ